MGLTERQGTLTRRCMVLGCRREGAFTATRERRGKVGVIVVSLHYCAEHYGQANGFHRGGRER